MAFPLTTFAAETGGLSALGLNVQSFLFQLITFVIVLVILRQFVFKRLVKTLEDRRTTLEASLTQAAETEDKLKKTEEKIAGMLAEARGQADEVVAASHKEALKMVEDAETKANKRAEQIVADAKTQMDGEVRKAREALKAETAHLVALATERIIGEKLDPKKDEALITAALTNAKERRNA